MEEEKTVDGDKSDRTISFANELRKKKETGELAKTKLETSDRVLARITDGIYRQPSSALRELISNAYDADATEVTIQTDAPKFETITIRDNGNGMSMEALSNLIHNIGGSIKRTRRKDTYGVVNEQNPSLSPRLNRKLIGKIGIGLFAVSQLTHHFQIITKQRGNDYRLFADIVLKTYTEDELSLIKNNGAEENNFQTGTVTVRTVNDPDIDSHGTDVILLKLKKHSRDLLRSREQWMRIREKAENENEDIKEPIFHIGKINPEDNTTIEHDARLPWNESDSPEEKFNALTQCVIDQTTYPNPSLSDIFDNYLNTIWTISLSVPLPYVEKHPFDIKKQDNIRAFELSNKHKGQAKEIELKDNSSIRDELNLKVPTRGPEDQFDVYFDEVLLKRPIMFKRLPKTQNSIDTPLIFAGKAEPDLSSIPKEIRGGKLSFEGYIFWNSKIVPKEHKGVLLRIHDSSGAMFDETFLKYQVSEQTRLRQITAEIFVKEGLDAALNIDRESFNYSHPHYIIITNWLHRALRQFTNKHKAIGKEIRENKRAAELSRKKDRAIEIAEKEWTNQRKEDFESIPEVHLVPKEEVQKARSEGRLAYPKETIIPENILSSRKSGNTVKMSQVEGLISILNAHNILEEMPYQQQESLIQSIVDLFIGE